MKYCTRWKNYDDNNNNARATFHGKFYKLDGAQTGPRPFHPIRIWVGSYEPRMLKLTRFFVLDHPCWDNAAHLEKSG